MQILEISKKEYEVGVINSLKDNYPNERQLSKVPTFLLTYAGTWKGIMEQTGLPEAQAKAIEKNYHELYKESDEWVAKRIEKACEDGFVTLAFGLKLRTPRLERCNYKDNLPYGAQKEARTAGNALGQSYCMLTMRAAIDFQNRLLNSPFKLDVKLIGTIHDAIYLIMKNDLNVIKWVNDNIVECMAWQELPEIAHDIVKLSGSFGIFYPSWAKEIELPKKASIDEIIKKCEESHENS